MKKEVTDVLVIGAGPSGCVSAAYLHNNGVKVRVVEKTKFPRLVVGESLIPRSRTFASLGSPKVRSKMGRPFYPW